MRSEDQFVELSQSDPSEFGYPSTITVQITEASAPENRVQPEKIRRGRVGLPAALFVLTCVSTFWAGANDWLPPPLLADPGSAVAAIARHWPQGLLYMGSVIAILLSHELGHFLMARRYGVHASLPFFLPVPIVPFGTLGAVMAMSDPGRADRKQIFDIGLAGPLAGLAVALPLLWIGVVQFVPGSGAPAAFPFSNPPLLQWLLHIAHPDYPTGALAVMSHPNAFLVAGWVALLVTGLNMLPISQLDGGHVLYGLLGRRALWAARALLIAAILFILATEQYHWVLMLVIVILLGVDHPPTANDWAPLGWVRRALGFASLLIPLVCLPWSVLP